MNVNSYNYTQVNGILLQLGTLYVCILNNSEEDFISLQNDMPEIRLWILDQILQGYKNFQMQT